MPELKQLSKEAIPAALEKAERYRLLNEPGEAESEKSANSATGSSTVIKVRRLCRALLASESTIP